MQMRALAICKQRVGVVPGQAIRPARPLKLRPITCTPLALVITSPDERLAFKAKFNGLRPVDPLPGLGGQAARHALSSSPHK